MLVILCACVCVCVFGGGREIKKEKEKETSYFPSIFCLSPLADNGLSLILSGHISNSRSQGSGGTAVYRENHKFSGRRCMYACCKMYQNFILIIISGLGSVVLDASSSWRGMDDESIRESFVAFNNNSNNNNNNNNSSSSSNRNNSPSSADGE